MPRTWPWSSSCWRQASCPTSRPCAGAARGPDCATSRPASSAWSGRASSTARGSTQHGWYYGKMWRAAHQRLEYADDDLAAAAAVLGRSERGRRTHGADRRALFDGRADELQRDLSQRLAMPRRFRPARLSGQPLARAGRPLRQAIARAGGVRPTDGRDAGPPARDNARQPRADGRRLRVSAGSRALRPIRRGPGRRPSRRALSVGPVADRCRATCRRASAPRCWQAITTSTGRPMPPSGGSWPRRRPGRASWCSRCTGWVQNTGWTERFPDLVGQIHRGGPAGRVKTGLLYKVKKALPWELVREVTTRLPTEVNKRLISLWSARMLDWSSTRFFALPGRLQRLRAGEPARARGARHRGTRQRICRCGGRDRRRLHQLCGYRDRRADRQQRAADRGAGRRARRRAGMCCRTSW